MWVTLCSGFFSVSNSPLQRCRVKPYIVRALILSFWFVLAFASVVSPIGFWIPTRTMYSQVHMPLAYRLYFTVLLAGMGILSVFLFTFFLMSPLSLADLEWYAYFDSCIHVVSTGNSSLGCRYFAYLIGKDWKFIIHICSFESRYVQRSSLSTIEFEQVP